MRYNEEYYCNVILPVFRKLAGEINVLTSNEPIFDFADLLGIEADPVYDVTFEAAEGLCYCYDIPDTMQGFKALLKALIREEQKSDAMGQLVAKVYQALYVKWFGHIPKAHPEKKALRAYLMKHVAGSTVYLEHRFEKWLFKVSFVRHGFSVTAYRNGAEVETANFFPFVPTAPCWGKTSIPKRARRSVRKAAMTALVNLWKEAKIC